MSNPQLPNDGLYLDRDLSRLSDKNPTRKDRKNLFNNGAIVDVLWASAKAPDYDDESTLVYTDRVLQELHENGVRLVEWRRLTDRVKAFLYHLGLNALANEQPGYLAVPFTMNLTANVVAQARVQGRSFPSWLQERIKTNLRRKLGRPVEFFFVVEIDPKGRKGRPHIHGELLLQETELKTESARKPIREALHMINDYSDGPPSFKKYAVRLNLKRCDAGWAGYAAKHNAFSKLFYEGKPIAYTKGSNAAAKSVWRSMRTQSKHLEQVIEFRQQLQRGVQVEEHLNDIAKPKPLDQPSAPIESDLEELEAKDTRKDDVPSQPPKQDTCSVQGFDFDRLRQGIRDARKAYKERRAAVGPIDLD